MKNKYLLLFFSFFIFISLCSAQRSQFSFDISANYDIYDPEDLIYDRLSTEPGPGVGVVIINGFARDVDLTAKGSIGTTAMGKMSIVQKKKWDYAVGLGLTYSSFDLTKKEIRELVSIESNELLQLSLIPIESRWHFFSNKLSLFANTRVKLIAWSFRNFKNLRDNYVGPENQAHTSGESFNNIALSLSGGAAFHLMKDWSLFAAYEHQITNVYYKKVKDDNVKYRSISLGLSFNF